MTGRTYDFNINAQRLLTKNMVTSFDRLQRLLCVYSGDASNDHRFYVGFLQHFIVVAEDLHTVEVFRCPHALSLVWSTRGYHVCPASEFMEIDRMALSCLLSVVTCSRKSPRGCVPIRPRPAMPTRSLW